MRKYWEVAKLLFKTQLAFRFDIAFNMLFAIIKILFAVIVWGAVFGARDTVAGFTLPTMLTYYVISAFLSGLETSGDVSREVSDRIRNGTFSRYLILPASTEMYFHAQTFGAAAMQMLFNLIAVVVWVFLFRIRFTVVYDAAVLLPAVLMVAMGLVWMVQFNFLLGLLAFRYLDVWLFLMIKGSLTAFATGTLVPLALLPARVVAAMRFLPFYHVTYLPSMLFIGRNTQEIGTGLCTLAVWIAVFLVINPIAFRHMRKKYDGVGI